MKDRISARIAANVRRQIAAGKLAAGAKLPPERQMALRYGVSRVTVREAYRSLEQSGILSIRRGAAGGAVIRTAAPATEQAWSLPLIALTKTLSELTVQSLACELSMRS